MRDRGFIIMIYTTGKSGGGDLIMIDIEIESPISMSER